jgi:hypothetical protein
MYVILRAARFRHFAVLTLAVLVLVTVLAGISPLVLVPAVAQNSAPVEKPDGSNDAKRSCIGCSADGKTTPRTPDGHPDLNGFWYYPPGTNLSARSADGSVLFDLGGKAPDHITSLKAQRLWRQLTRP